MSFASEVPETDPELPAHSGPSSSVLRARGDEIGRYLVLEVIGRGGMGVVYSAYDPQLDRKIALKLIRAEPTDAQARTSERRSRLLREAQAMARLSHPNVVAVHDAGSCGEDIFLAMEYVEGVTFDEWMKEQRPWREILRVLIEAGRGLAAAHAVGLIHRDFKPTNILVGNDGRVRVLDFGLARLAEILEGEHTPPEDDAPMHLSESSWSGALQEALTRAGALLGTPGFMAPEQLLRRAIDGRSDQFAFAVTLYKALYGRRPFEGKTFQEHSQNVLNGAVLPPPPGSQVPGRLRKVLLKGLAVRPSERYPSMVELLAALEGLLAPKRPWRWPAVGVAAVLLAAALPAYRHHDRSLLCRGAERHWSGVWDASRRAELEQAFVRTELPFAGAVFATVQSSLDRYAQEWTAMRQSACETTRLRGEQSEEVLDLRMICLDRRLQTATAQIEVLAQGGAQVVERAVGAVQSLPPIAECADIVALKAPNRLPTDPTARAHITAGRGAIAKAEALYQTGRLKEALALLEGTATLARDKGYLPIEAEANSAMVAINDVLGSFDAMERNARAALRASIALRDDAGAALALASLAMATSHGHRPPAEVRGWLLDATAHLRNFTGDDAQFALLDNAWAEVEGDLGNWEEALRRHRLALAKYDRSLGVDSLRSAQMRHNIAVALDELGRYDESMAEDRKALKQMRASIGPNHPTLAVLESGLGLTMVSCGRRELLDEARGFLEHSLLLAKRTGDLELSADIYGIFGDLELAAGRPAAARAAFENAHAILPGKRASDVSGINFEAGIGRALIAEGHAEAALPLLEHAIKIDPGEGVALFTLAEALEQLGRNRPRTRALAQAALPYLESHPRHALMAREARRLLHDLH